MVQGTTSDAGKSAVVTGLCRVLARRGMCVSPFKPQNMALNSAVTADGGEIGRAQAVQAKACHVEPTVHMNPVLLKPSTDTSAQVIFQGKVYGDIDAIGYQSYKSLSLPIVLDSFRKLEAQFDSILIEGAGSPAEINLRENDIANMGFAEEANVPVIIVADIDKGGVFAHLYGTLALLSESEQDRVVGFVINKFRGNVELLKPGLDWLSKKTGKPVLGVLPYLPNFNLESEDAICTDQAKSENTKLKVVVPVLPRISNHTDFDTLRSCPDIELKFVGEGEPLSGADLIILPGSKSVLSDLDYLLAQSWDVDIYRHLRYGGKVLGICGGYQMLGQTISDSQGFEGKPAQCQGLKLLNTYTEFTPQKELRNRNGKLQLLDQIVDVNGYEIHLGKTRVEEYQPICFSDGMPEGALSECKQVLGTYLHGILDTPETLSLICEWAGAKDIRIQSHEQIQQNSIDRIADAIEEHLDLTSLWPTLFKN
ncbi:Cobyric acid synthase [Vibrio marisflavi CECT 7928]|uniref:Cobyric acid synthase n=1 Tax=Vibrio marisflavi CECT 7928 TaxID=634439 RepID=A0ABN8DYM5_9VIBR|nr:cobyric acid synthase [Vibrio marisflavi]CAH0536762.1 Cobyric acid synthase [Vibrio marisflavi CECT 7928]